MASKKIGKGDITEMKSLANPPEGVIQMMTCAAVLLGHPISNAKEWMFCKRLLGSTDFLKNLQTNDPKQCSPENVALAKGIIDLTKRDDIVKKSKAAASLYDWNKEMVDAASGTS